MEFCGRQGRRRLQHRRRRLARDRRDDRGDPGGGQQGGFRRRGAGARPAARSPASTSSRSTMRPSNGSPIRRSWAGRKRRRCSASISPPGGGGSPEQRSGPEKTGWRRRTRAPGSRTSPLPGGRWDGHEPFLFNSIYFPFLRAHIYKKDKHEIHIDKILHAVGMPRPDNLPAHFRRAALLPENLPRETASPTKQPPPYKTDPSPKTSRDATFLSKLEQASCVPLCDELAWPHRRRQRQAIQACDVGHASFVPCNRWRFRIRPLIGSRLAIGHRLVIVTRSP